MSKSDYKIERAYPEDSKEILALYRTHLHGLAAWNENYPSEETIEFDLSRDALFIMKNKKEEIIATISIDKDEDVENLKCWNPEIFPSGELARLCVRKDMQNQGIARQMMRFIFEQMKIQGYKGTHILVRKGHEIALRSYSPLGFKIVGECELFEREFLCLEKSFD